jgi:hypothetical protein
MQQFRYNSYGMTARQRGKRGTHGRRGRPSYHNEAWSKVSVVLFDRQVARLDGIVKARRTTQSSLSRATIIRALVDGLLQSHFDLSNLRTEAELTEAIARQLAARSQGN